MKWIEVGTTIINLENVNKITLCFDEDHIGRYKIKFIFQNGDIETLVYSTDAELWESHEEIKQQLNVTLELEGIK